MNVFISHSHKDKEVVRKIADDLKHQNLSVWLDEDLVAPGEPWAEKLSHAVAQSDAVIVVVSRNTGASQWQTSEIAFAIAAQKRDELKRVIPVLIDRGAEVPFFLKNLLYSDLSDEKAYKQNFPQLINALQKPQSVTLRADEIDKLRIDSLKAERTLLTQEKEALSRKNTMWTTSVLGALASVIAATSTLLVGYLGNLNWGHRTFDFIIGALAGVLASLTAVFASRFLYKRSSRSEGKDDK